MKNCFIPLSVAFIDKDGVMWIASTHNTLMVAVDSKTGKMEKVAGLIGNKATIAKGKRSFTISTHLTRGYRWSLRVEYVHKGHVDTSISKT